MPFVPQDVLDRLARLERDVRQLTGRAQIRPAMNQIVNGDTIIGEGGQLYVRSADGASLFQVGKLYPNSDEFGFLVRREDGSIAIGTYSGDADDPDAPQAIRIKARRGEEIFVEDIKGGGLARPYLPLPIPTQEDTSTWPTTTATSWATIGRSMGIAQHPYIRAVATIARPSGTSGQLRLVVDGTAVITGTENALLDGTAAVPNFAFGKEVEFELQARVTSGPDHVRGMTRYLYGVQTP